MLVNRVRWLEMLSVWTVAPVYSSEMCTSQPASKFHPQFYLLPIAFNSHESTREAIVSDHNHFSLNRVHPHSINSYWRALPRKNKYTSIYLYIDSIENFIFFRVICRCPDGFLGNRCETKNPINLQPSTYIKKEQQQCGNNKFYGSYYC